MYLIYFSLIIFGICDLGVSASTRGTDDIADCSHMMFTRSSWDGLYPKTVSSPNTELNYMIIEETQIEECLTFAECSKRVREIQSFDMNIREWSDIGYSFLIGGDGNVYEGRGWNQVSRGSSRWHTVSLSIAFIGNFTVSEPSEGALDAARKLIDCGKAEGLLKNDIKIIGLRQVAEIESPGIKLYAHIKQWPEWMAGSP